MTKLTPFALQNMDVLHALADGGWTTTTQLAEAVGRDSSNLAKTLKALHEAGLIGEGGSKGALTPAGLEVIAAFRRAEGHADPAAGAAMGADGHAQLLWIQIEPDPLNPRKHFDDTAIDELADSIARDSLLENLVVRPGMVPDEARIIRAGQPLPMHRLVAGERRWRAIGRLIVRGAWPKDRPITCKIVDLDDAGHRRVALVENLQRKDLRPIDEAQALRELMTVTGQGTAEIAREIGFTQRFVQQRLQLLELPEKLQEQVNAGDLPIEKARTAMALLPKLPPIKAVALQEGKLTVDEAKAWLDDQPPPVELSAGAWLMALEIFDAIARKPMKKAAYEYERAEVGQGAAEDALFEELRRKGFYQGPTKHLDKHHLETGKLYVSLTWGTRDKLVAKFGDDCRRGESAALQPILAMARRDAGAAGEFAPGAYQTAWLNRPIVVPDVAAAAYAAALAQKEQTAAAEKARREAEFNAALERKAKAVANAEVAQTVLETLAQQPPAPCDPNFAECLAATGWPTPWRMDERGRVEAANGREIMYGVWYQLEDQPWMIPQRALMVAAVNLAAGAAFTAQPDAKADGGEGDQEPMSRGDFERAIAGCLSDDLEIGDETAARMASSGVDAQLRLEDDGGAEIPWDYDGAMSLAEKIRVEDFGQQVDLEAAIAAAGEGEPESPEISPALMRLAGVPAEAAAD